MENTRCKSGKGERNKGDNIGGLTQTSEGFLKENCKFIFSRRLSKETKKQREW